MPDRKNAPQRHLRPNQPDSRDRAPSETQQKGSGRGKGPPYGKGKGKGSSDGRFPSGRGGKNGRPIRTIGAEEEEDIYVDYEEELMDQEEYEEYEEDFEVDAEDESNFLDEDFDPTTEGQA